MAPHPAVSVSDLSVAYDGHTVLEHLSFDVPRGSITAVIGPNGSGKTTLFRAILGLTPFEGDIRIFGKPAHRMLHRVAYVPQRMDFDRTMPLTVREFLELADMDAPVHDACSETGIQKLEDVPIGRLSGGQLQRVLIARALSKRPDLLLLDEASAGIDVQGASAFYELVRHANREHKASVMLISHEINIVARVADRVICLNRSLVCNGPLRTTLTHDVLAALYGDHLPHHHEHGPDRL